MFSNFDRKGFIESSTILEKFPKERNCYFLPFLVNILRNF